MAHSGSDLAPQGTSTARLPGPSPHHQPTHVVEYFLLGVPAESRAFDIPRTVDLEAGVGMHGFRKGHQRAEVITIVRLPEKRRLEWSRTVTVCQLDFARACDRVAREAIRGYMRRSGVPAFVSAAWLRERKSSELVFSRGIWQAETLIPDGVLRRGCSLSPLLLSPCDDGHLVEVNAEMAREGLRINIGFHLLQLLCWADDTWIFAETPEE